MNTAEALAYLNQQLPQRIVDETEFLGQTTVRVDKKHLKEVLAFLKRTPQPGFEVLMDLTGVDYLNPAGHYTKLVYFLHHPKNYARLRLLVLAARDEVVPSICDLWEGADWYERELYDLFGIRFEGHPDLKRILMPDDWKGHPLRRDYALTEESVEFKHGVKPKIPSEIIPYVTDRQ